MPNTPKPDHVDLEPRFDGRFVEVRLFVNTDEDHIELARRMLIAARGEQMNAATVLVNLHPAGEKSIQEWGVLAKLAAAAHAHPNAEMVDLSPDKG